jgi:hypothetical protein
MLCGLPGTAGIELYALSIVLLGGRKLEIHCTLGVTGHIGAIDVL